MALKMEGGRVAHFIDAAVSPIRPYRMRSMGGEQKFPMAGYIWVKVRHANRTDMPYKKIKIPADPNPTYDGLVQQVKCEMNLSDIQLSYQDSEKDFVELADDEGLTAALLDLALMSTLKVYVSEISQGFWGSKSNRSTPDSGIDDTQEIIMRDDPFTSSGRAETNKRNQLKPTSASNTYTHDEDLNSSHSVRIDRLRQLNSALEELKMEDYQSEAAVKTSMLSEEVVTNYIQQEIPVSQDRSQEYANHHQRQAAVPVSPIQRPKALPGKAMRGNQLEFKSSSVTWLKLKVEHSTLPVPNEISHLNLTYHGPVPMRDRRPPLKALQSIIDAAHAQNGTQIQLQATLGDLADEKPWSLSATATENGAIVLSLNFSDAVMIGLYSSSVLVVSANSTNSTAVLITNNSSKGSRDTWYAMHEIRCSSENEAVEVADWIVWQRTKNRRPKLNLSRTLF